MAFFLVMFVYIVVMLPIVFSWLFAESWLYWSLHALITFLVLWGLAKVVSARDRDLT